jgi:hypothetical protein
MKPYSKGYYTNMNYTILDLVKQNTKKITVYIVISNNISLVDKLLSLNLTSIATLILNEDNMELYKNVDVSKICLNIYDIEIIKHICNSGWFTTIVGSYIDKIYYIDNDIYI